MTTKVGCYENNSVGGTWSSPEVGISLRTRKKDFLLHGAYPRTPDVRAWKEDIDTLDLVKLEARLIKSAARTSAIHAGRTIYEGVPLYRLLEVGSAILATLSAVSLATWVYQDIPLVHPLAAAMCLLASPFFFLMGRVARAELTRLE